MPVSEWRVTRPERIPAGDSVTLSGSAVTGWIPARALSGLHDNGGPFCLGYLRSCWKQSSVGTSCNHCPGMMHCMASTTFEPYKKTLGQLLSSTSPPLRVPDYQRDYSWEKEHVSEFWEDLKAFAGNDCKLKPTGQYFLGATVLVDNGDFHLVLDGQQRLATATILLAALRDRMAEFNKNAAKQLQDQFVVFQDELSGEQVFRLELNTFDRSFFRDFIQAYPHSNGVAASTKSQHLISRAYEYFAEQVLSGWAAAGGGKQGFEWASHIAIILRDYFVVITTVSTDEKSAASIFTTLNDRGIGLSSVDLVRSFILQNAHKSQIAEILDHWEAVFNACGKDIGAEALMRMSWVSTNGDLKTRALYKVLSESLGKADNQTQAALAYSRQLRDDALLYRRMRDGDADDPDLEEYWLSLRYLKFNAGYPLLFAAQRKLNEQDQKSLAKALRAITIRHNLICNLDRASLESLSFTCAKAISGGASAKDALVLLRSRSPKDQMFAQSFATLSFSTAEHGAARYLLRLFDEYTATTQEVTVAGADRVHVEHIYPQTPKESERWEKHSGYVNRLGNLTLLDRRLNEQIKNSDFQTKKTQAYESSKLEITRQLLTYPDWSPERVEERQASLLELARKMWPEELV